MWLDFAWVKPVGGLQRTISGGVYGNTEYAMRNNQRNFDAWDSCDPENRLFTASG